MRLAADALRAQALALGFNLVGITPAEPSPTLDAYLRWIDQGMHGTMPTWPARIVRPVAVT